MTKDEVNKEMERMFNVAVTRAKFKLFIVGNFSYCQKKAKNNALSNLLKHLIIDIKLPLQDAKILFPKLIYMPKTTFTVDEGLLSPHILCQEDSFDDYFLIDIQQCRERLIIYSPFLAQNRLSHLLPHLADASNRGCSIIVVTKALSDIPVTQKEHFIKCVSELRKLNIFVQQKKGMHEKAIFVDDFIVWFGSLNALSFTGNTGELMERYEDKKIADEFAKIFDTEHLIEVAQNPDEQSCPICNSEILAAESDKGGFYWTCINKDYTRQPSQPYPYDGVFRCKCGSLYTFAMKKQPRWMCLADSSHYQQIKENDLKLEKMFKLIPKIEQTNVLKYFSDKRKEYEATKPTKKSQKIKITKKVTI